MSTATVPTDETPAPAPDPELAGLVPRRSRGRSAALVAVTALALAAAWVSPDVLRGELPTTGAGMWGPVAPNHVVAVTELAAPGLGARHVDAVRPMAGAEVAAAWVVPGTTPMLDLSAWEGDPLAEAAAAMPDADPLPARLPSGQTSSLVVLWRITDCDALENSGPTVLVRALVGTTEATLEDWAGPGFDVQLLRDEGACP